MSADTTAYQINVKTPSGTLINLRATDEQELSEQLEVLGRQLKEVGEIEALIGAMENVFKATSPSGQSGGTVSSTAASAPGNGPSCAHGAMTFREGQGAKGKWTAHFCPQPKGAADQCKPVWGDR